MSNPHFYSKGDGSVFGAFALTESTETILPIDPRREYKVDGKIVNEWKMILISTTLNKVIAETDYYEIIEKMREDSLVKDKTVVIKALTLEKMKELI
ncbi:MAG: DUF4299 domain-containing protein [Lachnospiraceae bacterium]|nr:DUF4299 domain-containing protein [Lachnospiraceae bacterium]